MNYNDENNVEQNDENKKKRPVRDRLSSAYDRYQDYNDLKEKYNANGLGGLAKGMAQEAINNKVNQVKDKAKAKIDEKKDKAKEKINAKKDELKDKARQKIDSKLPDSVKQKRDAIKNKGQALRDKANQTKDKFDNVKNQIKDAKKNLNENTFRRGVRAAVNAAAPGAGTAAEKMLDFGKGKKAVDAARNASNPIAALKEGTTKLLEVVATQKIKKKLIVTLLPCITTFMVVVVVLSTISKFVDSQIYAKGNGESGGVGMAQADEKYQQFYDNVEKYGTADKAMVISVLTSYKDNDKYTDSENYDDSECTDEEIANGECFQIVESGITKYSKSKMKKYIKEVNKAIEDSNGDVTEGDYSNPENTGSEFFKWLYNEFVEEYYEEYMSDDSEIKAEKKVEIVRFIYLYYKDIADSMSKKNGYCNVSGEEVRLTAFDDANVGAAIDKSKVKVKENGWKFYEYEGKDYLAVATATNVCIDTGCGKTGPSSKEKNYTRYDYITYYDYMDTLTLTIDGKMYDAIVVDSCGGCQWSQEVRGDATPNRIDIWTTDYTKSGIPDYGTLNSNECGITGDQILLGNQGIYSTSIFPVSTGLNNVYLTQGYRYDGGGAHGAIDLFCNRSNASSQSVADLRNFCTSLPIVASHYGTVISVVRGQNCANSAYSNLDSTLPVSSKCDGNSVIIEIKDKDDPFYGYRFHYWHLDSIAPDIHIGLEVATGQLLGYMGSTGRSTGWHLHFAILNSKGQKLNQNDNILKFVETHGLYNDGIRPTNEGPKF